MSSRTAPEPIAHTAQFSQPSLEKIRSELASATSVDDFFGKRGIFSRLFAKTIKEMMEAELTAHLGYDKHSPTGYNSGNSRNGSYPRTLKTSAGETAVEVPRDRNGSFSPQIVHKYQTSSNELEDKIISMYAKGMTTRDIQDMLEETYGINTSAATISTITEKVMSLVVEWQARPLEIMYPLMFLDAIHVRLKREGRIQNTAVYSALAVNLEGRKDVLGHWVGDGSEGANFWLSVITDLKNRGVKDILIACVDGLTGFSEAIHAVYPQTEVQRCIIHQIRNTLKYVSWKDKDAFMMDLRQVYQANTKDEADKNLVSLRDNWGKRYTIAVRSWENNWAELATFFQYTPEIRRIMYTTNSIESYNRQLRKVTKTKSVFPTTESVQKMLYLAYRDICKEWDKCIPHWPSILNQLIIKFEGRIEV